MASSAKLARVCIIILRTGTALAWALRRLFQEQQGRQ